MKSGIKTAVSLLAAVAVFAGVLVASSFGMFSSVERTFYEPAKLKVITEKLEATAAASDAYLTNLVSLFGGPGGFTAEEGALRLLEQSVPESALASVYMLMEKAAALDGIRIIDSAGRRVLYSYFKGDARSDGQRKNYGNYDTLKTVTGAAEIPYEYINAVPDGNAKENPVIFYDGKNQRILFSLPLAADKNLYSVVFYVNPLDFKLQLAEQRIIAVNEKLSVAAAEDGAFGGFVFGLPEIGADLILPAIIGKWKSGSAAPEQITVIQNTQDEDGTLSRWNIITSQNGKIAHVAGIYPHDILSLPQYVRILLFICAFITVCLVVLILFSMRKDDDVVIENAMKRVQFEFLKELVEKDADRTQIAAMLQAQKGNLSAKIKKALGRRGKKNGEKLDAMLERSWEDIISVFSGGTRQTGNMKDIRALLEELLSSTAADAKAPSEMHEQAVQEAEAVSVADTVSEIEPAEELEEIGAEDALPLASADDVPDLEPVEDAADDVAELEPAEELEEIDAADALDLEPVEDAAHDVAELEPAEELEEIDAADVLDLEPVEDTTDAIAELEPDVAEPEALEENAESDALLLTGISADAAEPVAEADPAAADDTEQSADGAAAALAEEQAAGDAAELAEPQEDIAETESSDDAAAVQNGTAQDDGEEIAEGLMEPALATETATALPDELTAEAESPVIDEPVAQDTPRQVISETEMQAAALDAPQPLTDAIAELEPDVAKPEEFDENAEAAALPLTDISADATEPAAQAIAEAEPAAAEDAEQSADGATAAIAEEQDAGEAAELAEPQEAIAETEPSDDAAAVQNGTAQDDGEEIAEGLMEPALATETATALPDELTAEAESPVIDEPVAQDTPRQVISETEMQAAALDAPQPLTDAIAELEPDVAEPEELDENAESDALPLTDISADIAEPIAQAIAEAEPAVADDTKPSADGAAAAIAEEQEAEDAAELAAPQEAIAETEPSDDAAAENDTAQDDGEEIAEDLTEPALETETATALPDESTAEAESPVIDEPITPDMPRQAISETEMQAAALDAPPPSADAIAELEPDVAEPEELDEIAETDALPLTDISADIAEPVAEAEAAAADDAEQAAGGAAAAIAEEQAAGDAAGTAELAALQEDVAETEPSDDVAAQNDTAQDGREEIAEDLTEPALETETATALPDELTAEGESPVVDEPLTPDMPRQAISETESQAAALDAPTPSTDAIAELEPDVAEPEELGEIAETDALPLTDISADTAEPVAQASAEAEPAAADDAEQSADGAAAAIAEVQEAEDAAELADPQEAIAETEPSDDAAAAQNDTAQDDGEEIAEDLTEPALATETTTALPDESIAEAVSPVIDEPVAPDTPRQAISETEMQAAALDEPASSTDAIAELEPDVAEPEELEENAETDALPLTDISADMAEPVAEAEAAAADDTEQSADGAAAAIAEVQDAGDAAELAEPQEAITETEPSDAAAAAQNDTAQDNGEEFAEDLTEPALETETATALPDELTAEGESPVIDEPITPDMPRQAISETESQAVALDAPQPSADAIAELEPDVAESEELEENAESDALPLTDISADATEPAAQASAEAEPAAADDVEASADGAAATAIAEVQDAGDAAETVELAEPQEDVAETEPSDAAEESPRQVSARAEFQEALEFGEPKKASADGTEVADDFLVIVPLEFIVEKDFENYIKTQAASGASMGRQTVPAAEKQSAEAELNEAATEKSTPAEAREDIYTLEPIDGGSALAPFSFTHFAEEHNILSLIDAAAIVQGEDGVFRIAESIPQGGIELDDDFLRLVNDVLKNRVM